MIAISVTKMPNDMWCCRFQAQDYSKDLAKGIPNKAKTKAIHEYELTDGSDTWIIYDGPTPITRLPVFDIVLQGKATPSGDLTTQKVTL